MGQFLDEGVNGAWGEENCWVSNDLPCGWWLRGGGEFGGEVNGGARPNDLIYPCLCLPIATLLISISTTKQNYYAL